MNHNQMTTDAETQNQSGQDMTEEMPELQELDSIIAKVSDMMRSGQVDLEELKMDLENFKNMMMNPGDESDNTSANVSGGQGVAGMIDEMQGGK